MSNPRPARRISWIVTLACALLPASASGAVTVGSNLDATPVDDAVVCATGPCTAAHQELPAGSTAGGGLRAPTDGVVVRWRIKVGEVPGAVALRITTPGNSDARTGAGTSAEFTPTANQISTFGGVRLPISAGDALGIDFASTTTAFAATADAISPVWEPALSDVEQEPRVGSRDESELLVNADIEPDADGDGFGDETQDLCPTDATTQGICPVGQPPPSPGPGPAPQPPGGDDQRRLRLSVDRRPEVSKRVRVAAAGFAASRSGLLVYADPRGGTCPRGPSNRGPRAKTVIGPTFVQGDFQLEARVKLKSRGRHSFCAYLGSDEGSGYTTVSKKRKVLRPRLKGSRARRTVTRAIRTHKFARRVVKHLEKRCRRKSRIKFSCDFSSVFPGYRLKGSGTVRLDGRLTYRFRVRAGGKAAVLRRGNEGRFPG